MSLHNIAFWLSSNLWVTALVIVIAPLGVIISFILYFKSKRVKCPIYDLRHISLIHDFDNYFKSVEIKNNNQPIADLTVTRFIFWNAGRETIRKSDITAVDPFEIKMLNGSKILEAGFIQRKNKTNNLSINIIEDGKKLLISFDYLDFEEGGIIQILHTAKTPNDIEIKGTFIGSGKIKQNLLLKNKIYKFVEKFEISKGKARIIFSTMLFLIPLLTFIPLLFPEADTKINSTNLKIITNLIIIIVYWFMAIVTVRRRVPKGFDLFEDSDKFLKRKA